MAFGHWAIGSYCLVVIRHVFALFGSPKYPIANYFLCSWLFFIFSSKSFTKFIKMFVERP